MLWIKLSFTLTTALRTISPPEEPREATTSGIVTRDFVTLAPNRVSGGEMDQRTSATAIAAALKII